MSNCKHIKQYQNVTSSNYADESKITFLITSWAKRTFGKYNEKNG